MKNNQKNTFSKIVIDFLKLENSQLE